MWSYLLCVIALLVISITHWIYRWRNPKCNGKLPPGSMGLPLIGETLDFMATSKSIDIPSFIKKRMAKYGPMFKTSLVGRPVVVVSDPSFSYYLFQQEGKLVERWYMDSFGKLLHKDLELIRSIHSIHKYVRNLVWTHFGTETLKTDVLPNLQNAITRNLNHWSSLPSLDVKKATSIMIFNFTAKLLFSYEAEKSSNNLGENLTDFLEGVLMKFPLNIPGTTYHRCLQKQKEVIKLISETLKERRKQAPKKQKEDLLDHILEDIEKEAFLTDKFTIYMMFGLLFASFETISSTLTLALKLITDHPSVAHKLMEEHEAILKTRGCANSGLSWEEYKSMTYTHQVVKESLRLGSVAPGLLRRTLQDIEFQGYTIPKDWIILIVPAAIQLNPNTYEDPLAFNPSRWEKMGEVAMAKNFIAFGGGSVSCTGAEFSKFLMALFLHLLVTKYKWTKIKEGEVVRSPVLAFGDGFHIQLTEKL